MNRGISSLLVLLGLLTLALWVNGNGTSAVNGPNDTLQLDYLSVEQPLSLAGVRNQPEQAWSSLPTQRASFGYTDKEYWLRTTVNARAYDRILYVGYPLLDELSIYWLHDGKLTSYQLGDHQPFYQRPILSSAFAVPLPSGQAGQLFIRANTDSSMRLPVRLYSETEFFDRQMQKRLAEGIYFGVLLCMAVYNLFSFFASREPEFGLYSLYTVFFAGLMLSLDGLGFRYLWPDNLFLQEKGIPIFGSLTFLTAALFAYQLLNLKEYRTTLARGLFIMAGLSALTLLVALVGPYQVSIHLLLSLAAPGCLYLLIIGIYLWRKGFLYARIFTIAWGALLISVMANSLGYLGIIDSMFIQRHAIMIGSGIEILLLSWVLAVRYNEQRRQKLDVQRLHNEKLEDKVDERTFELQIALRELQDVNAELERRNYEDALTKLYNRRYFTRQLEKEYRRALRNQGQLSLVMIDIDHFKKVNDTHGHFVGDQILQGLATRLKSRSRRPADVVCRYGGEEFAVILPDCSARQAKAFAEKLVNDVRASTFNTDTGPQKITISVGIAVLDEQTGQSTETLFKAADEALYRAKRDGRDQVVASET
ncbi:sensor domain-containing diguanylate cyclase [Idiomarina seosinensis]|uniref:sensor domain-containing diguanylate cyclase n=1 Tax=Idiomarina seosinensis TaxID=281739 RepID=UPI00384FBDD4